MGGKPQTQHRKMLKIRFFYDPSKLKHDGPPKLLLGGLSDPHWNDFIVEGYYFTKTPMGAYIQQKLEALIYR